MSTHTIGGWNIEKGGFTDYATELPPQNPKQDRIASIIQSLGADSIVISDAQGWGNPAVRAVCLPEYNFTSFTPLEDDWLTSRKPEQCHLGVAFATNSPIAAQEIIDLGNRQGVSTTLNIGVHGLRIAGVYLNHYSEDMRIDQARALLSYLDKDDTPTVIIGDLNTQQALHETDITEHCRSLIVKLAAAAFSAIRHPYSEHLSGLEQRKVLPILSAARFSNTATDNRATALFPIAPLFRVDHALVRGTSSRNYQVHPTGGASDHRPITIDLIFNKSS